jgi:hypothetical protein
MLAVLRGSAVACRFMPHCRNDLQQQHNPMNNVSAERVLEN